MKRFSQVVGLLGFLAGCGGSGATIADDPTGGDAGTSVPAADAGSSEGGDASGGANVEIHVVGSVAPVPHDDGFAGQTPSIERVGITSLRLFRDTSDATGLTVFDLGAHPVEASLADEADTIVARVPARSLAAGHFTVARVGVSHVYYRVAATVHAGAAVAGQLETVQAMSDGAVIDGAPRSRGFYESTFTSGAYSYGPTTGTNPVPKIESTGGIRLDDSTKESAYVFPVDVVVDPAVGHDVRVVFTVNVHQDFRWQDQAGPGYATGVFDTTTTTFEPVMSFGANAFSLVLGS